MQIPLRITFRDMDPSDAVDAHVRARAARIEPLMRSVTSCHVTLALPHGQHHGSHPRVRIDLAACGKDIVVDRDPGADKGLRDMHACIDAAFDDATRMLRERSRARRATRR